LTFGEGQPTLEPLEDFMADVALDQSIQEWSETGRDMRSALQRLGHTPEAIRAEQVRLETDDVEKRRALKDALETVVSGYRELLEAGHKVDVDARIDQIDEIVDGLERETRETSRMMSATQKWARAHDVAVATALGQLQQSYLARQRFGIETFDAARWELILIRARHLSPEPKGKPRGEYTDLDAYLASLD
jgi:hypothetical protein